MFNQQDVEIIDDDLADKEDDGLHAFVPRHGQAEAWCNAERRAGSAGQICDRNRGDNRLDDTRYAETIMQENKGAAQLDHHFQNEVLSQTAELIGSLHEPATHAQRNVQAGTDAEQNDVGSTGQIEVLGDDRSGRNNKQADHDAYSPRPPMQSLVNGHLGREFLVLGDELGAHQLVGQGHRREQHQQRVNGGGVPKPGGAEEARNPDVVDQVGGADHAGADQHDHAAAEKSRPQCQDGGGSSLSGCILIHDLGVYDSGPILL